jgi:hypothetical protein
MKMKNIILFLGLSTAVLFSSSCKKDFLQRDAGVAIDLKKIFSDPVLATKFGDDSYNYLWNDFASIGVNAPNNSVGSGNCRVNWYFSDECLESRNNSLQALYITRGIYLEDNTLNLTAGDKYTEIAGSWQRAYQGIRNTSRMLEEMDNVPWTSDQSPDRIKGEQYFIRAFMYFELIKRFGGVPIVPKVLSTTDNADLPRNTYQECVDYILADLAKAEPFLPLEYDVNAYGRATKGAVKALRSRVLLYAASYRDNPTNDKAKWTTAASVAKDLIDNMKDRYPLESTYTNILKYSIKKEFILCMPKSQRRVGDDYLFVTIPSSPGRGGNFGNAIPTQTHVNMYEMANGKPITDPTSGYDPQNPYVGRDPRFYENILFNGAPWGSRSIETWQSEDGKSQGLDMMSGVAFAGSYLIRKMWPIETQVGGSNQYVHFPIFRMAEIWLNYAEAQNEAVGPDISVYDAVNQIRRRAKNAAGVAMPDLPAGLTQVEMRNRIRNERAVELAFENGRWFDIMRWGIGKNILNGPARQIKIIKNTDGTFRFEEFDMPPGFTHTFVEKQNYYPIPLGEIQKSIGILKQNPGWGI